MSILKWQYETHIGNEGNTLSLRGDGNLHENVFDIYVDEFMLKYRHHNVKKEQKERINIKKGKIEWCVVVHTSYNGEIKYPGRVGGKSHKILT